MRSAILTFLIICLVCGLASAEVKGKFTAGDQSIEPKFVCAYPARDQYNAREELVEVVLSVDQVDPKAAVESISPHTQMINQDGMDSNYVIIFVGSDGKVGMNACFAKTMTQYLSSTQLADLKADFTANTPDRIAGHVYNPKPLKTRDGIEYQADFTFDTVVTRPPAGTKLGDGGGEPGKAFLALLVAMEKKDRAGLNQYVSKETLAGWEHDYISPEENLANILENLSFHLPQKAAEVTGGEIYTDYALLDVEGETNGLPALFTVRMVKVGSGWALKESFMAGML